jgi:hypothetical protein
LKEKPHNFKGTLILKKDFLKERIKRENFYLILFHFKAFLNGFNLELLFYFTAEEESDVELDSDDENPNGIQSRTEQR